MPVNVNVRNFYFSYVDASGEGRWSATAEGTSILGKLVDSGEARRSWGSSSTLEKLVEPGEARRS